jgi:dihydrofolate reductase
VTSNSGQDDSPAAKEALMRKVVLSVYVSLDGISDMDQNDQWTFPYWNDELQAHQQDLINRADALLMGRKMFEHFSEAWSPRTNEDDPMADRMNAIPKYVASRGHQTVEGWNGRLLEGDAVEAVTELKRQDGPHLLVYAAGEFVGTLIKADLIDEYHLIVHPVVLGSGKRLFPEGLEKQLMLRNVKPTSTGVTVLTLEPAPRAADPGQTSRQ